jgi:hypothetical protein
MFHIENDCSQDNYLCRPPSVSIDRISARVKREALKKPIAKE